MAAGFPVDRAQIKRRPAAAAVTVPAHRRCQRDPLVSAGAFPFPRRFFETTMDQTERQIIDDLFAKLRQADSGPRDPEAEAYIRDQVSRQPAAPYLMAQSLVMLEQALAATQQRVTALEQQVNQSRSGGGGLFGSLFGGSRPPPRPVQPVPAAAPAPWGQPAQTDPRLAAYAAQPRAGGGFLAGAAQTAMGVAGGMLLGNALADMFSGGEAVAQEAMNAAGEHLPAEAAAFDEGGFDEGGFGDEEI